MIIWDLDILPPLATTPLRTTSPAGLRTTSANHCLPTLFRSVPSGSVARSAYSLSPFL